MAVVEIGTVATVRLSGKNEKLVRFSLILYGQVLFLYHE